MLAASLTLGTRWTFVGGKGGVGKTTVAAALGVELADTAAKVLLISVDPAHSLGDALGIELGPEPRTVPSLPRLEALEVDSNYERDRFLAEHGSSIAALLERGTYLDVDDVREVRGLAAPGSDELAAMLRLGRLARGHTGRVIVDTAPTGHTLRLLDLPRLVLTWLDAFDAMERKHAAIAVGLVGRYSDDEVSAFLRELRTEVEGIAGLLRDANATRVILVSTAEAAVAAETVRFHAELDRLGVAVGGVVVNRAGMRSASAAVPGVTTFIPILGGDLGGPEGLGRIAAAARTQPADSTARDGPAEKEEERGERARSRPGVTVRGPFAPPSDRKLYLVGGKGGVGKTTVAAAVAIRLADAGRRVLLLSVDPAGSLAEVLDCEVSSSSAAVAGMVGLDARQLDAPAVWADFRDHYRAEVSELFSGFVGGGAAAAFDRDIVDRLIDLAPPGLDELTGLMEVIDLTVDREYDALVVDTAPTGHMLRLLAMPELALDWCHMLLRLLLKYRNVMPLSGPGEKVLRLARSIRAFRQLLADEDSAWCLVVALPESLSVPETKRLLPALSGAGIRPAGILVNRTLRAGAIDLEIAPIVRDLMAIDPAITVAGAPIAVPGPTGPERLRAFIREWSELDREWEPVASASSP